VPYRKLLWHAAKHSPTAFLFLITQPIVHTAGATLPKLHIVGGYGETAPVFGTRHILSRETRFILGASPFESTSIFDDSTLGGCPRAELARTGPCCKIAIGFRGGQSSNGAFDTHLAL